MATEAHASWIPARIFSISPDMDYCRADARDSDRLFGFRLSLLQPKNIHLGETIWLRTEGGIVVEAQADEPALKMRSTASGA